jgi:hypothetical protein
MPNLFQMPQKLPEPLTKEINESPNSIGIDEIIEEKPPTKIVREFIRTQLNCIEDENESLFRKNIAY